MAKRKRTVGYTVPIFVGKGKNRVRIPIKGKTLKSAKAKANSFRRHHLKNVEKGFYDSTGFHPIRSSKDYAPYKVDEWPKGGSSKRSRSKRGKRR